MIPLQTIGGRRFSLAVLAQVCATALQAAGHLDPSGTAYAIVISATVGAYVAGNTAQKIKAPHEPENQQ